MSRPDTPATASSQGFMRYAWGVLAYMVAVILWGAFVRATGSGAGCGSHWPLCNGEIVPRAASVETLIELSHRLTSAFAGLLVIGLVVWAFRAFGKGHPVRRAAVASLVLVLTEGAIGAAIVLYEWVATDASLARTISIALHLNNTFLLLGALTFTAWWASGGRPFPIRDQGLVGALLVTLLVAVMLLSTAGAITALGDTLFMAASTADALARAADGAAHHLERLRVYHPALAVLVGLGIMIAVPYIQGRRAGGRVVRLGRALQVLYAGQILLGFLNIFLRAPVWMQLVHLFVADAIWIVLLLFANAALAVPATTTAARFQSAGTTAPLS